MAAALRFVRTSLGPLETSVYAAGALALTQGLVFWLMLSRSGELSDAIVLGFGTLTFGAAGENLRISREADDIRTAGWLFALGVLLFTAIVVVVAKGRLSVRLGWDLSAYVLTAVAAFPTWAYRAYLVEKEA